MSVDMLLYDSLTKTLKTFPPDQEGPVKIYACGPTVYHYVHIGNLRTFLTVDLLRRYLEYKGRDVKLVMNITDVGHMLNDADVGEDSIEKAAGKEGKTPQEIAAFYERAFFADLEAVNFQSAWKHPRATEHIPEMVALIEKLIDTGHAYATERGDIYYDVASFKSYGRLSGNKVEDLVAGARVEVKNDKRHPADFALWINNPKHVLQWKGPRGVQGYPGWHIECSAMAAKYLGETIDLHAGGEDLKFPHHECEIAQSEGANNAPFSRHWLHVTHLLIDGEKMSRSKGNFYTLQNLLDKGYSAEAVRTMLLSVHYRTQLNFTLDGLKASEDQLRYLRALVVQLQGFEIIGPFGSCEDAVLSAVPQASISIFEDGLDKDLNVAIAWSAIMQFAAVMNRAIAEKKMVASLASDGLGFLEKIESVMAIGLFKQQSVEIPTDVQALADKREMARAEKRWQESDRLRDELAAMGWIVEDTSQGQKLKKA